MSLNCDMMRSVQIRPVSRFSLTSNTPKQQIDKQILRLAQVNELSIVQKPVENVGSIDDRMSQYAYDIKDGKGENIYTVSHIHGPQDPFFELKIFGSESSEPIIRKKLFQTVPTGLLHMQIYNGTGAMVGLIQERRVEQGGKIFFELKNCDEESICIVSGNSSGKILFRHHKILSADGHREIGKISKMWNTLFTGDNLNMNIDVPQHLPPQMKILLIGVPILLRERYTR